VSPADIYLVRVLAPDEENVNTAPGVTIVIPAYNVSAYIRQAVESALGQTAADLEVLVVDDGSTDATLGQLAGIADPRLKIARQPHSGPAKARNRGVRLARSSLIGFLDGDDYWLPNKLEKHLDVMVAHPETHLTFSLCRAIDPSGSDYGLPFPGTREIITSEDFLGGNIVRTTSSVVARKDALIEAGLFDPRFSPCEDYELWIRLSRLRPANIRCIPEVLAVYRRRSGQLTADWRSVERAWTRIIDQMCKGPDAAARNAEPQARSRMCACLAVFAYQNREFREALRLLWLAFRFHPQEAVPDCRNWLVAAACASGEILPGRLHRKLERLCVQCARSVFADGSAQFIPDSRAQQARLEP